MNILSFGNTYLSLLLYNLSTSKTSMWYLVLPIDEKYTYTHRKWAQFQLISWGESFVERHSFYIRKVGEIAVFCVVLNNLLQ